MNLKRIAAVIRKETLEIIRDPITLGVAAIMPLMMLFLFGYAISLDIANVPLGVLDHDRTPSSRALVDRFTKSGYFRLERSFRSTSDATRALRANEVKLALVMPHQLQKKIERGEVPAVQVLVDGTFSATAVLVASYARSIVLSALQTASPQIMVETRIWYNPELRSVNYVVPGLFGVILMAFPPLLTALAICREKETGTIDQIFVSPLTRSEFLAGKLVPYGIIAFFQIAIVILAAVLWFNIPTRGNLALLLPTGLIYVFCTVGIGLLVSTITRSQLIAMLLALIVTLMPSFLFSGFLFPVFTMPLVLQFYARVFPASYFVDLSRGVVLKGTGLPELWPSVGLLLIYSVIIFALAVWRFRKKVA